VNLERIFFYGNNIRVIGENLVRPTTGLKVASFQGNVCTGVFFFGETDIVGRLTTEFTQNCGVNCTKAKTAVDSEIEKLVKDNLKLNNKLMSMKMEKQSLKMRCE
jgi:hypothetical protein